jgi:hypothetical protein
MISGRVRAANRGAQAPQELVAGMHLHGARIRELPELQAGGARLRVNPLKRTDGIAAICSYRHGWRSGRAYLHHACCFQNVPIVRRRVLPAFKLRMTSSRANRVGVGTERLAPLGAFVLTKQFVIL